MFERAQSKEELSGKIYVPFLGFSNIQTSSLLPQISKSITSSSKINIMVVV